MLDQTGIYRLFSCEPRSLTGSSSSGSGLHRVVSICARELTVRIICLPDDVGGYQQMTLSHYYFLIMLSMWTLITILCSDLLAPYVSHRPTFLWGNGIRPALVPTMVCRTFINGRAVHTYRPWILEPLRLENILG